MKDEEEKEDIEIKDFTTKLRQNPWMTATIILAVVVIGLIGFSLKGSTGSMSKEAASQKLVAYVNTLADSQVTLISSKDIGSMYEVQVSYQGQAMPLYISKDGNYWTSMLQPLQASSTSQPKEVVKSDKPIAEAFVFSYCPYGLQFEKALIPVYKLLKAKADIRIVFIGAMHGEYEEVESIRQVCIRETYGNDKLFTYLESFASNTKIGDCEDNQSCSLPLVEQIFTQLAIDKTKINSCMAGEGKTLYQQDIARAQEMGVSGSPTFAINGAVVSVGRSPAAVLQAVCSGFNTQPAECSQALSSESASPWFGSSSSSVSGTGAAAQCN